MRSSVPQSHSPPSTCSVPTWAVQVVSISIPAEVPWDGAGLEEKWGWGCGSESLLPASCQVHMCFSSLIPVSRETPRSQFVTLCKGFS